MVDRQGASLEGAGSRKRSPLAVLAAWTVFAPLVGAGLMWLLFKDAQSSSGAIGAYVLLGYGGAVLVLGGCALLGLWTLVRAVRTRRWAALAVAPGAFAVELGLVWWLLDQGHLWW